MEQATGLGPILYNSSDIIARIWPDLDLSSGASQPLAPAYEFYLRTNDTGSPALWNVSLWGTIDEEYSGNKGYSGSVAETNEQNNTCLSQFTVEIRKNPHH